jgi:hypothetical protein
MYEVGRPRRIVQEPVEDGRTDVEGYVRQDPEVLVGEVYGKGIPSQHLHVLICRKALFQTGGQESVVFYGHHPAGFLRERAGEHPRTGSQLYNQVSIRDPGFSDYLFCYPLIFEKILA